MVRTDGYVCATARAGAAHPLSEAATAPTSIFETYGGTREAEAELQRLVSGAAERVAFDVQRGEQTYEVRARGLRDDAGHPRGAVGLATRANERPKLEQVRQTAERGARQGLEAETNAAAQRAQEQRHEAAEAQLRHAVNSAPFVLWAVDAEGVFTLSEGRGLAALGLRPGQVVGMSAFEFYKDVPQIVDALRRGLAGGHFTEVVELGGRVFETRTFHVPDADGRSAGMVGLSLDITERQQAEAERMKLQAKLLEVQRLESLGLMAGGVAHDFNNILTVILGNAESALFSLPEASPAREDMEAVITAARRAADLTRQMLAYSGRAQFDVRAVDVSSQVRDISALLRTTIPGKVQLSLALGDVPAVLADPAQIQQVVMNLVLNAAEAIGDEPGSVTITTRVQCVGDGEALTAVPGAPIAPGSYVLLEVRDSGAGMDPATIERIFDPFFTTKFTGRGLGLAAVLGIVRAHHGAIQVHSTPGKGSTFRVFLPSYGESAQHENPAGAEYVGSGLVLVIDDDAEVRQTLRKMLGSCGFSVIEATDGRSGVRVCEQRGSELTLVLLDVTMPDMDGRETFRALRELSRVPVVLMSGYGEHEATRRVDSSGLAGFLQKPFSLERLSHELGRVVRGRPAPG